MDTIIKWLFIPTEDGATNLQVIIVGGLLMYVLYVIGNTFTKIRRALEEEEWD